MSKKATVSGEDKIQQLQDKNISLQNLRNVLFGAMMWMDSIKLSENSPLEGARNNIIADIENILKNLGEKSYKNE